MKPDGRQSREFSYWYAKLPYEFDDSELTTNRDRSRSNCETGKHNMVLSIAGRNNGRPEADRVNKSFTIGTLRCACVDARCEKNNPPSPFLLFFGSLVLCRGVALRNFQRGRFAHANRSIATHYVCCVSTRYISWRAQIKTEPGVKIRKIVYFTGKMIGGGGEGVHLRNAISCDLLPPSNLLAPHRFLNQVDRYRFVTRDVPGTIGAVAARWYQRWYLIYFSAPFASAR